MWTEARALSDVSGHSVAGVNNGHQTKNLGRAGYPGL